MKSVLTLGCAAAVALFLTAGTASAQCGYGGVGYGGYGGGGFYGGGSGLSIGYSSYAPRSSFSVGFNSYPGFGYSPYRSAYRSRGHYDYHPTSLVRHGNHFHVQPGHYDYHRGSHHRGRYHR